MVKFATGKSLRTSIGKKLVPEKYRYWYCLTFWVLSHTAPQPSQSDEEGGGYISEMSQWTGAFVTFVRHIQRQETKESLPQNMTEDEFQGNLSHCFAQRMESFSVPFSLSAKTQASSVYNQPLQSFWLLHHSHIES